LEGSEVLVIKGLRTVFCSEEGVGTAVDGVDLALHEGEILGVVGESGCGKSATALSVMRLVPQPPGIIEKGEILFDGRDLLKLSNTEMREIRGNKISMIFQEPISALNPVFTIGDQICESIRTHAGLSKKEALTKSIELLKLVGIPSCEQRLRNYPYEMSGGMCQRVMIAMAISCRPKILLADEPTTALDVTIQGQILRLIKSLRDEFGTAIMLITHNLGVIAEVAENVAVMYAGKIVEQSGVNDIFTRPFHPYTRGLLDSVPRVDRRQKRLSIIPGVVPSLFALPQGCCFHNRCMSASDRCVVEGPPLVEVASSHYCRCWLYS
jgi:oligopeptide/dipeptide ABC transporter ATP-binding protein